MLGSTLVPAVFFALQDGRSLTRPTSEPRDAFTGVQYAVQMAFLTC